VLLDKPITTPRYAAIVQGLSDGLAERGLNLALLHRGPATRWIDAVRGYQLDGLVFVVHDDHEVPTELAEPVVEYGIPFVALDCGAYGEARPYSTVDFDYGHGVETLMAELERRLVRVVYYVRPDLASRAELARERAVLAALGQRSDMALRVVLTGVTAERLRHLDEHPSEVGQYAAELAGRLERALDADGADLGHTALVCSWGTDVETVYRVAQRYDKRITVGSLAAGVLSPSLWPDLVYSRLPLKAAGHECARLIVQETDRDASHEHLLLPPTLDMGAPEGP
jgi:DNA-binding LacI/PurR family transcriptional regulator